MKYNTTHGVNGIWSVIWLEIIHTSTGFVIVVWFYYIDNKHVYCLKGVEVQYYTWCEWHLKSNLIRKCNLIGDNSYINIHNNIHKHNSARYLCIWHFTVLFLPCVNIVKKIIYTSMTIEMAMYLDESLKLGMKQFSEQLTIVLCTYMYNIIHLSSVGYLMHFTKSRSFYLTARQIDCNSL